MPAGRPCKPTKLKILSGNPGKRPLPTGEPTPEIAAPKCPAWLSRRAKDEWKRITPELLSLGLLTRLDLAALAGYCQAFAELERATRVLDKDGCLIESDVFSTKGELVGTRLKAHPAVALQRDAFARVKAYLAEFGLSPSARVRVKGTGGDKGDADPLDDLMKRNGQKQA